MNKLESARLPSYGTAMEQEPSPTSDPGFLERVLATSPNPVYVFDLESMSLVYSSGSPGARLGYSPEEVAAYGSSITTALLHPEDAAQIGQHLERVGKLMDGEVYDHQYRLKAKDGTYREFTGRSSVFKRGPDGRPKQIIGFSMDVTQQHEAARAARNTAERLQIVIDKTPLAIMALDLDGVVQLWNPAAEGMFGWAADEVIGHVLPAVPDERLSEFRRNLRETAAGNPLTGAETTRLRKGNIPIQVAIWSTPMRDENGMPDGVLAIVADVTERREAEAQLRQSQKAAEDARRLAEENEIRLSQKLEAMPNMAWASDAKGHIDFVNRAFREYAGFWLGNSKEDWARLVHPHDLEASYSTYSQSLRSGQPSEWESRMLRRDGDYRWHISRLVAIRDSAGRIIRWFGTSTDIHQQKAAVEEIQTERERLRLALETAHAGAWEWDVEMQRMRWSREMYDLHGVPYGADNPIEIAGQLTVPGDLEVVKARFHQSVTEGVPFDVDGRIWHPERGLRWLHSRGTILRDNLGEMQKIVGVTFDVTDRKAIEVELARKVHERTAQLETANRELEGFTYSVSHDLRAPLRAINATSATLKLDFAAELPEDARQLLQRQAQAASKMGQLIDDLLKLSRLGREQIRIEPLDLTQMCATLAEDYARPGIEYRIQDNLRCDGDPRLIRFVLQNLMENSAKFSPDGGIIDIGSTAEGEIFVRDQGVGFEMAYAHKLFLPFERLHRDSDFPGTGIGLANVKRIVERHGGSVRAESGTGKGATFYFSVPESPDRPLGFAVTSERRTGQDRQV